MANDLVPFQAPPPPALVDARGRPLRNSDLTREIAGPQLAGVRSIMSGHPAQGLDPQRLAQILRAAESGEATAYLELAEEMEEKDLHYLSVMGTRKRAVSQLPIRVEAASDDPNDEADAQLIRDWMKRLTLQAELFDILDGVGKGYSATEIIWELTADAWLPKILKRQDPRFFEFDRVTGEELLLKTVGLPQPLPPHKFIVHHHPAKSGLPIRGGLARAAAWGYLFKNFTIKDWMAFLEVYGLPLRVGKYAPGTTEGDIRKLEQAVAQIGSDAGAVIPQSMMLEFITSGGSSNAAGIFKEKAVYIDDQLSKAVLGQTSSSDAKAGGLGSGQADLHGEVRHDIETADAVQLSASLSRDLAVPMVMFNRGVRKRYPLILVGRPDRVDVEQALKSIDAGTKLGVPIAISTFRELTGLPEPKEGEELLQAPAQNAPQEGPEDGSGPVPREKGAVALLKPLKTAPGAKAKQVSASVSQPDRELDGIDRAIEDELGDWERLIDPALSPIEEELAAAGSWDDVKTLLADRAGALIQKMDTAQLTEILARADFGAQLAGRLENPEG